MEKQPLQPDPEFIAVIKDNSTRNERNANITKKLEGLDPSFHEFKKEELEQVVELRQLLLRVKQRIIELGSNQTDKVYENLAKTQEVIDNLWIWDTKFTTGDEGKFTNKDSVYYTTPSGIALRFKMSNVETNIGSVIQPFMENIVFLNLKDFSENWEFYPKQMPEIGLNVDEYSSEEFYQLQNQPKIQDNFISQVPLYFKGRDLYYVGSPKHVHHHHPGSSVNKIIFIK